MNKPRKKDDAASLKSYGIDPLLSVPPVAEWLQTTQSNVYLLARKGLLPSVRFATKAGRETVRFRREDVEKFIADHLHGNGVER